MWPDSDPRAPTVALSHRATDGAAGPEGPSEDGAVIFAPVLGCKPLSILRTAWRWLERVEETLLGPAHGLASLRKDPSAP